MNETPPVAIELTKLNVPHQIFNHSGTIKSLDQAAAERGQVPDQVVRSILFRTSENNFVMVLVTGPLQISWQKLRAYLGQSRLTLATEEEVLLITEYRVGAVSPYGLPRPVRILADKNVFAHSQISIGSGQRGTAIILNSGDLLSSLENIEIATFVDHQ